MTDPAPIRPGEAGDAPVLSALYRDAVLALGPRAYAPAQVAAWAALTPAPDAMAAMGADGRARFVADAGDGPLGFADLEGDGHLALLYVAPTATGRGVGSALLRAALAQAERDGLARVFTEASEIARPVFARAGWRVCERRDFAIGDGVVIHNWAMARPVDAAAAAAP
jgi:putative acetyltransferase